MLWKKTMKVSVLQISETRLDKVLKNVLCEIISSRRRAICLYLLVYYSVVLKIQNLYLIVESQPITETAVRTKNHISFQLRILTVP